MWNISIDLDLNWIDNRSTCLKDCPYFRWLLLSCIWQYPVVWSLSGRLKSKLKWNDCILISSNRALLEINEYCSACQWIGPTLVHAKNSNFAGNILRNYLVPRWEVKWGFPEFYRKSDCLSVTLEWLPCLDDRVVITPKLRIAGFQHLHSDHLDVDKIKSLAWPKCGYPKPCKEIWQMFAQRLAKTVSWQRDHSDVHFLLITKHWYLY